MDKMPDPDKARIRPLKEKSDYSLWRLRVVPAISLKGLKIVFKIARDLKEVPKTEDPKEKASNIIITSLGNHALRVVRSVTGESREML